jgi:hypothetical protein
VNDDLADSYNTVLKMANKRALVAGILNVTAASDVFTQDLEDFRRDEEEAPAAPQRVPPPPEPTRPAEYPEFTPASAPLPPEEPSAQMPLALNKDQERRVLMSQVKGAAAALDAAKRAKFQSLVGIGDMTKASIEELSDLLELLRTART